MTETVAKDRPDHVLERRSEAALLGAAIGDALGWPHEMRARRAGGKMQVPKLDYMSWTKQSGGRFQPYEEQIESGSYSDDTQLILAVARSIGRDPAKWWQTFAVQELPFWTIYERGGGGATKRAATSWSNGHAPWTGRAADVARYFEAGGNGAAMRVLPHAVRRAGDPSFGALAQDVMTDGVCTHGHPRALVGALAYAYALWVSFRHRGTLGFGQLLDNMNEGEAEWSTLPPIVDRWSDWQAAADKTSDYRRTWDEAVVEQRRLFERSIEAIAAGAASFDDECLEALGCFDKRVNGAGTVTAAGALYLASRHAADPAEGLRVAALAVGADTDTLASMTCALLGAAIGGDWLLRFAGSIQDKALLVQTARELLSPDDRPSGVAEAASLNRKALTGFLATLDKKQGEQIALPNGVPASITRWTGLRSKIHSMQADGFVAKSRDGQTYFIKSFRKLVPAQPEMFKPPLEVVEVRVGIRLAVVDLRRSRDFYHGLLGLAISRETEKSISFGGSLAFGVGKPSPAEAGNVLLYIEVADVDACLSRLVAHGAGTQADVITRGNRRHFGWSDPDGYTLELYARGTG